MPRKRGSKSQRQRRRQSTSNAKRRSSSPPKKPAGYSYRQNSYRAVRRGGTVKRGPATIKKRREPAVRRRGSRPARLTLGQSLGVYATALKSATSQRLRKILKLCKDRPDPRAAGKERQRQRRAGGGSKTETPRKFKPWCN